MKKISLRNIAVLLGKSLLVMVGLTGCFSIAWLLNVGTMVDINDVLHRAVFSIYIWIDYIFTGIRFAFPGIVFFSAPIFTAYLFEKYLPGWINHPSKVVVAKLVFYLLLIPIGLMILIPVMKSITPGLFWIFSWI
jgi:hypothetical protein